MNILNKIVILGLIIIFTLSLFVGVITLIYSIINFNLLGLSLALSDLAINNFCLYFLAKNK